MTSPKKSINYKKIVKNLSKNYWTISTIVLAILLIAILISGDNTTVSTATAGQRVLDFAKNQYPDATLISTTEEKSMYQVVLLLDGQEVPVYVTKDGANLIPSLIPLAATTTPSQPSTPSQPTPTPTVTKSDKPKVELFIMSHCPYGTQMEKGILPVVGALGDTIDFEIKFVYYAMHPSYGEVEEQLDQYCIQKEQNDKFIDYLTCWLGKTGSEADGAACLTEAEIDKTKLTTCTTAADAEFNVLANLNDQSSWLSGRYPKFDIHKTENDAYGIGGSPTLVINGAQASAGRDSASILRTICAAFNEAPEECNTQLPSTQPGPGFGWSTTQAAATAAQCS